MLKMYAAAAAMVVAAAVSLFGAADGQMHHVVGGDRGWELATDLASWLDGRSFRVGDRIWFAYSAAEGGVYELGSTEEYYTCDLTNPIKMYTDGLNSVHLTGEGTRYFASSNSDRCKSGLKLHVDVLPPATVNGSDLTVQSSSVSVSDPDSYAGSFLAAGPTTPSGSAHVAGSLLLLIAGLGLGFMGL